MRCELEFSAFNNYFRKNSGKNGIRWLTGILIYSALTNLIYFFFSIYIDLDGKNIK